jgi:hypothetical protein
MDLTPPSEKMSKSTSSTAGALRLLDEPAVLRRKVAVTDTGTEVAYDPQRKPGTSNPLAILASCTNDKPQRLAPLFNRYGELKEAVPTSWVPPSRRSDNAMSSWPRARPGGAAAWRQTGPRADQREGAASEGGGRPTAGMIGPSHPTASGFAMLCWTMPIAATDRADICRA